MDEKDVAILRAMGAGPQPQLHDPIPIEDLKPPRIAEKVGLSVPTVKDRLRAMTEAGAIHGAFLAPNGAALGLQHYIWHFDVPERESTRALERIEALPFVTGSADFIGPGLLTGFHARAEDVDEQYEELCRAVGPWAATPVYRQPYPRLARAPTRLDARIMIALWDDPLRSLPDVAEEVGVSSRTVRTRLTRLIEERAFYTRVSLDRSRMPGLLFAFLHVVAHEGEGRQAAMEAMRVVDQRLLFAALPPALNVDAFDLGIVVASVAELDALRRAAEKCEGIAEATMWVPRRYHENYPMTRHALAKLAQLPEPKAAPAKETSQHTTLGA